ncbi:competence/damage-inducible protein A [Sulfurimonas marina]|uniref:Competence/damage-inducible protein A n=1 Tax=Sulfurimonas marina TaxID=2590551 RepID=A0A7M1AUZ9_9BACT|nr:molybdopterin-binding protein [Sulfurimonas marina]QOP41255.1 competence/damage-inducible protein A [Sulfurimonas marina]
MNFYAVIIGTEILNGRRVDKHFEFLKQELAKFGHELFASLVIKDDETLITNTYKMIKEDPKGVMFSFGGIGSTPDDLTRSIASQVFRNAPTQANQKFLADIIERFGDEAYPHRIHMAELPPKSDLLFNPVNNMSGFSLDDHYFFVPGFPSMAHPMLSSAIKQHFSKVRTRHRKTLYADTSENTLISVMKKVPDHVELSSLPIFVENKPNVELSLIGEEVTEVEKYFEMFTQLLKEQNISYKLM